MNPIRWLQVGFLVLLLGGGAAGVLTYRHMATKVATADVRIAAAEKAAADATKIAKDLKAQVDTLSAETIRRSEFDSRLREARGAVSRNLDTASREDPSAAGYLSQPIPQRVRDAYAAPAAPEAQR